MQGKWKRGNAQTSVDFLIGFSIFAVTLLFVLQMASGSVVNTAPESETQGALAERAAAFAHNNISEGNGSFAEAYKKANSSIDTGSSIVYSMNFTATNVSDDGDVSYAKGGVPDNTTSSVSGSKRVAVYRHNGEEDFHLIEIKVWQNGTR
jgi:hypothetical protein